MTKRKLKKKIIPYFSNYWEYKIIQCGKDNFVRIDLQDNCWVEYFTTKELQGLMFDLIREEHCEGVEQWASQWIKQINKSKVAKMKKTNLDKKLLYKG